MCWVAKLGLVLQMQLQSRAQRAQPTTDRPIALGSHHTLYYQSVTTKEQYHSSVDEIMQWIRNGPVLQLPLTDCDDFTPVPTLATAPQDSPATPARNLPPAVTRSVHIPLAVQDIVSTLRAPQDDSALS